MNSSLLVPAFVVVAVTAMFGVFFGNSLFQGGAETNGSDYAVSQPQVNTPAEVAANASQTDSAGSDFGSDFSWDDESPADTDTSANSDSFAGSNSSDSAPGESYVSSRNSDDAPGEVFPTSQDAVDTADDVVAQGNDVKTDAPAETRVASKKVDDGLDDFFNIPAKSNTSSAAPAVSAVKKEVEPEVFSQPKASEAFGSATRKSLNDLDSKVAVAAPKKAGASFDNFDFGNSFSQANEQAKSNQAKSIVSVEPVETPSNSVSVKTQANSGQEISGNLEPVASGLSGSADGSGTRSTSLRKFKITNPKETSLAVTLSVRGKKITLQPDQTFVVSDSDDIKVTFSRGGSFGFENQTLKAGHYRFSVTREAGWKLSN